MQKNEIIRQLKAASDELTAVCNEIDADTFFRQYTEKWSIAQNVKHLLTSTATTRLAYRFPKWFIRIYAGIPNRDSRSYDGLVEKYQTKLREGGKAKGRYIPKPVWPKDGKDKLLHDFSHAMHALAHDIETNWKDTPLDKYLAPHPLLGKLTLRELAYFTIYHTYHHLETIKGRLKDNNP